MPEPLVRTQRAASLSLVVSLLAMLPFAALLASVGEAGRLWAWGMLICAITATLSVIPSVRAPR